MKPVPASVIILTRDSAGTVSRALESVEGFGEVIIADAASKDATRDIAKTFGARIIDQNPVYLTEDRRITDFSAIRNQALDAASYPWRFFLDSDEMLTPALLAEMERIVTKNVPGAYWVPRKYTYHDRVIERASTYPIQQMRFFHSDVVTGYIKPVHERIELKEGVIPKRLSNAMLVPLPETADELTARWKRYLAIEATRLAPISKMQALRGSFHELLILMRYLFRIVLVLPFKTGAVLPFTFERARLWYQLQIISRALKAGFR